MSNHLNQNPMRRRNSPFARAVTCRLSVFARDSNLKHFVPAIFPLSGPLAHTTLPRSSQRRRSFSRFFRRRCAWPHGSWAGLKRGCGVGRGCGCGCARGCRRGERLGCRFGRANGTDCGCPNGFRIGNGSRNGSRAGSVAGDGDLVRGDGSPVGSGIGSGWPVGSTSRRGSNAPRPVREGRGIAISGTCGPPGPNGSGIGFGSSGGFVIGFVGRGRSGGIIGRGRGTRIGGMRIGGIRTGGRRGPPGRGRSGSVRRFGVRGGRVRRGFGSILRRGRRGNFSGSGSRCGLPARCRARRKISRMIEPPILPVRSGNLSITSASDGKSD